MEIIIGIGILLVLALIAMILMWRFFPGFVATILRFCFSFTACLLAFSFFSWELYGWKFWIAVLVGTAALRIPSELREDKANELALAKENAERASLGLAPVSTPTNKVSIP